MAIENENKKPSYNILFRLVRELGIPADLIFYLENNLIYPKAKYLIRLLSLCDEHDLNIIISTTKSLLENKK